MSFVQDSNTIFSVTQVKIIRRRLAQKLGGYLIKLHLTIMDVQNLFKPVNKHRPETIKKTLKKHKLQYLPVIFFSINDVQHFLESAYKH